jgi:hypothetical protein
LVLPSAQQHPHPQQPALHPQNPTGLQHPTGPPHSLPIFSFYLYLNNLNKFHNILAFYLYLKIVH